VKVVRQQRAMTLTVITGDLSNRPAAK
jgi:hypothetical protein